MIDICVKACCFHVCTFQIICIFPNKFKKYYILLIYVYYVLFAICTSCYYLCALK